MTKLTTEQIKRQKALAWLKRVAYETPCMKEVKTCIEVLSAPAQPAMPVQEIVGWIFEDELPKNYPYDTMFVHSKVDVVRMFPVFSPSSAQPVIPEQRQMVPDEIMPSGLVYSSVLPEFESNDSDKVVGYHCLVHGKTRSVMTQEQAYSDAMLVVDACRAAFVSTAQPVSEPYKLNGWISVDNELPEEGVRVLVFSDGAFVLLAEFTGGEFYDVVRDGEEFFETVTRCITHWMPLPEPPAQESE